MNTQEKISQLEVLKKELSKYKTAALDIDILIRENKKGSGHTIISVFTYVLNFITGKKLDNSKRNNALLDKDDEFCLMIREFFYRRIKEVELEIEKLFNNGQEN